MTELVPLVHVDRNVRLESLNVKVDFLFRNRMLPSAVGLYVHPLDGVAFVANLHTANRSVEQHLLCIDRTYFQHLAAIVQAYDFIRFSIESVCLPLVEVLAKQVLDDDKQDVVGLVHDRYFVQVGQVDTVGEIELVCSLMAVFAAIEDNRVPRPQLPGQVVGKVGAEELLYDIRYRLQFVLAVIALQKPAELLFGHLRLLQNLQQDNGKRYSAFAQERLQCKERLSDKEVVIGIEIVAEQIRLGENDGEILLAAQMYPFQVCGRSIIVLVEDDRENLRVAYHIQRQQVAVNSLVHVFFPNRSEVVLAVVFAQFLYALDDIVVCQVEEVDRRDDLVLIAQFVT